MAKHLITSATVSKAHPHKIEDQISEAVVDAILIQVPKKHVACEAYVK
ncbi:methionine adenosyltransferase, partial [Salmonella enterica subsp. enterica serovar Typhimurium]